MAAMPRSKSPAPVMTRHSAIFTLPTPDISSIAAGAHYAGSLSPTHPEFIHHTAHRTISRHEHEHELAGEAQHVLYDAVVADLTELFCGRPTPEIMTRRWRPDATLEDPFSKCVGARQCAAHWAALSKIVRKSEQTSLRIISATLTPNRLVFAQTQVYTIPFLGVKTINSIVDVDLDENMKIIRLLNQWDGERPSAHWLPASLRKMMGKLTSWLVRMPRERR